MIVGGQSETALERAVQRCRDLGVVIPTIAQQIDPRTVPEKVARRLPALGPQEIDPLNLFRITWKNDAASGSYGSVDSFEIPRGITGIDARVIGLVGAHFPTGSHKVGASFGCLVPRLVSGGFDPTTKKAVWPSTGNYCRGGAFDSALLGCPAIAILPREMSGERFAWLEQIGAEVIATPGSESNVKEIYDKCWEIRATRPDCVIFNQFEEFGNAVWHYHVTGRAVAEAFATATSDQDRQAAGSTSVGRASVAPSEARLAAYVAATGSAGTIAAGDYLRSVFPRMTVAAAEALQCPTLLRCGFGAHRIEGIGDKHVPWIHNVRNTDVVIAVDDEAVLRLLRVFNEPAGLEVLAEQGVAEATLARLPLLGISGIANLVAAVKLARYFELDADDVVMTVFTDSVELYGSRLLELNAECGPYTRVQAIVDLERHLRGAAMDNMRELDYYQRKALHNLKYYTWVEQQGKTVGELDQLWSTSFWDETFSQVGELDRLIDAFNERTGVLVAMD